MSGVVHIVGAGIAGLAAALTAARIGQAVRLYEAAPQPGGRCRTVAAADGFRFDNGTHALLAANRAAMSFLDAVGARENWIEPELDGLPMVDAVSGEVRRVSLSPFQWLSPGRRRPAGLAASDLARMAAAALPGRDRPVAEVFGGRAVYPGFVEPLATACLNTSAETASTRRFGQVLTRLARPGAGRLYVARRGLSPDLVEPALRALRRESVGVTVAARLKEITIEGGRATRLAFGFGPVSLTSDDRVVLALPPQEVARLLPGALAPSAFESIANVHFRLDGPETPRLVGVARGLSHWILMRDGCTSVTISAASGLDPAGLAGRVWPEVRRARRAVGLDAPAEPADGRVVVEKRATIRHAVGDPIGFPQVGVANLAFCGDWGGPLPATIEAAVASGVAAGRGGGHAPARAAFRWGASAEASTWSR